MTEEQNIALAADAIYQADAMLITAGAGIGVDSGLPDFRGNEGFWKAYPPIAKLGYSFADMANPEWFGSKPNLAWAFYGHRLNLYRKTVPHNGFHILRALAEKKTAGYFVFTSNVDGQFQKAGYDSTHIEECHGSIHHFQCVEPCCNNIWSAAEVEINIDEEIFSAHEPLPTCTKCGGLARPNILMFGDWLWIENRTANQAKRLATWLNSLKNNGKQLVIIELGAGKMVPTVRLKSRQIAQKMSATLIRINPHDFATPNGGISLPYGALSGIQKIAEVLAAKTKKKS